MMHPSLARTRRWLFAALALFTGNVVLAQTATEPPAGATASEIPPAPTPQHLNVAVVEHPPFMVDEKGVPAGFSVELWQEIANLNKWTFTYTSLPSIRAGLEAVKSGQYDVLVSDTSITSSRLEEVDFSHPFFRGGFQIMITDARPHTWRWVVENIGQLLHMRVLQGAFLAVVLLTLVVAFFERKHNPTFPKVWHEGLAEAFYLVSTLTLTGKSNYKGFPGTIGRMAMVFWTIFGVLMVAFVTSTITTTMTVEKLAGHIDGPEDLPGKPVGVLAGGLGEQYAIENHLDETSYPNIAAAAKALVAGQIQAIVDDAAELQYYDKSHPELPITEVGPIFERHDYGFAVKKDSPLRHPINQTLVLLNERGFMTKIGNEYFGNMYRP